MNITDRLDGLRAQHPSCTIAVFADLSTGLVLAATSIKKTSQERLDALSDSASNALRGALAQTVAGTLMNRDTDCTDFVMHLSSSSIELFVEAPQQSDEALCLVCSYSTDVDGLVRDARNLLNSLEAEH